MSAHFLDARFDQCRRPLWDDSRRTPVADMMVCGAATLPGRTYCAECRGTLIAGVIVKGQVVWFNAHGGRPSHDIDEPEDDRPLDFAAQPTEEVSGDAGRPLALDVQRLRVLAWGMAA
ncbi:hypothetical protein ACFQ4O_02060 [Methylopila musalis]|uniref:Uncharacterized protein n=1 Tax=Methylopila musalis TaxID=1134781 RepID=A0ABW3Z3D2_9HYPH